MRKKRRVPFTYKSNNAFKKKKRQKAGFKVATLVWHSLVYSGQRALLVFPLLLKTSPAFFRGAKKKIIITKIIEMMLRLINIKVSNVCFSVVVFLPCPPSSLIPFCSLRIPRFHNKRARAWSTIRVAHKSSEFTCFLSLRRCGSFSFPFSDWRPK